MTDEEKLQRCVDCFERKLRSLETWNQFKNLLENVTKEQVKTFIVNCLSGSRDDYLYSAGQNTTTAGEISNLMEEVDGL